LAEIPEQIEKSSVREVKTLFNEKAKTWGSKYQTGGPLAFRVAAFRRLLSARLVPANSRVLDLGCGTASIAAALSATGFQVTACDVADEMIAAGKQAYQEYPIEWHLLDADWRRLPFERQTFDGIVASSVFEYLPDVSSVLVECQRILRPAGI
jgi:ubiquinone/menaquinone biosynthesis C-methylase UbiE